MQHRRMRWQIVNSLPWWAWALIFNLSALVVALALLVWAIQEDSPLLKTLLQNLAAIVLTSGLFSWWGAFLAKVEVVRALASGLKLSEEVKNAGLRGIGEWPIDIPTKADEVDMVLIRGHAWFTMQIPSLRTLLRDNAVNVRVCLVHPHSPIIPALSAKFGETEEEVRSKILDSILSLVEVAENARCEGLRGHLVIRCHKLVPTHSYYRFDEQAYVVWYRMRGGRTNIPLLSLGPGLLQNLFQEDFENLWVHKDTEQAYDSSARDSVNQQALRALGASNERLERIFRPSSRGLVQM